MTPPSVPPGASKAGAPFTKSWPERPPRRAARGYSPNQRRGTNCCDSLAGGYLDLLGVRRALSRAFFWRRARRCFIFLVLRLSPLPTITSSFYRHSAWSSHSCFRGAVSTKWKLGNLCWHPVDLYLCPWASVISTQVGQPDWPSSIGNRSRGDGRNLTAIADHDSAC